MHFLSFYSDAVRDVQLCPVGHGAAPDPGPGHAGGQAQDAVQVL